MDEVLKDKIGSRGSAYVRLVTDFQAAASAVDAMPVGSGGAQWFKDCLAQEVGKRYLQALHDMIKVDSKDDEDDEEEKVQGEIAKAVMKRHAAKH